MVKHSVYLALVLVLLASPVAGVVVTADGPTLGSIVTSYLFATLYLIATFLSVLCLLKTINRRVPYSLLLLSSAFFFGAFVSSAALLTSGNSDRPYSKEFQIALNTIYALFANWAVPSLFLAVVLIAKQRHAALNHATGGQSGKPHYLVVIANYVIFIFTFALSTMDGVVTLLFVKTALSEVDGNEQRRVGDIERNVHLILQVMFCVVAYDVVALSVALYMVMRKEQLLDNVCQLLAFCVAPLAALAGVASLVFEVTFYIQSDIRTLLETDVEHLLNTILVQLLLLGITVSLLILGLRPQDWEVSRDAMYDTASMQKARDSRAQVRTSHYQLQRLQHQASGGTQPSAHSPHSPVAQYWRESLADQYGQGHYGASQYQAREQTYPTLRHQYALASTAHVPSIRDAYTQEVESMHRQYSRHR